MSLLPKIWHDTRYDLDIIEVDTDSEQSPSPADVARGRAKPRASDMPERDPGNSFRPAAVLPTSAPDRKPCAACGRVPSVHRERRRPHGRRPAATSPVRLEAGPAGTPSRPGGVVACRDGLCRPRARLPQRPARGRAVADRRRRHPTASSAAGAAIRILRPASVSPEGTGRPRDMSICRGTRAGNGDAAAIKALIYISYR